KDEQDTRDKDKRYKFLFCIFNFFSFICVNLFHLRKSAFLCICAHLQETFPSPSTDRNVCATLRWWEHPCSRVLKLSAEMPTLKTVSKDADSTLKNHRQECLCYIC
ncbi:MAG TPA: hypothetical protein PLW02_05490, partial [Verrucomicrobiota bacterium]|nr:hypothetical protein [Verrucomicrobiota bacterium]